MVSSPASSNLVNVSWGLSFASRTSTKVGYFGRAPHHYARMAPPTGFVSRTRSLSAGFCSLLRPQRDCAMLTPLPARVARRSVAARIWSGYQHAPRRSALPPPRVR